MEQWTFNRTYSGVPQGSGVSPVLANIYLHELDKFMENYAENFNTEAKKKHFSTAYKSSVGKAYRYRKRAERYGIVCLMKKRKSDAKILRNWK